MQGTDAWQRSGTCCAGQPLLRCVSSKLLRRATAVSGMHILLLITPPKPWLSRVSQACFTLLRAAWLNGIYVFQGDPSFCEACCTANRSAHPFTCFCDAKLQAWVLLHSAEVVPAYPALAATGLGLLAFFAYVAGADARVTAVYCAHGVGLLIPY